MRFLCLHGRGTNSDILEFQLGKPCLSQDEHQTSWRNGHDKLTAIGLAPLISQLSPEHTFDYVDAQVEGTAAPGIGGVFPGPYFIWHKDYDPSSVEKVHQHLQSVLKEDGPYDGIIGFSEGAALAASYLLAQEYRASLGEAIGDPEHDIKLAVFLNSVKPYSPSEQIGHNATHEFHKELRRHSLFLKGQIAERRKSSLASEEIAVFAERRQSVLSQRRQSIIAWKNSGAPLRKDSTTGTIVNEVDEKGQGNVWNSLFSPVFCFDPNTFSSTIRIPTLHIIGSKDQFRDYSREVTRFCDQDQMEIAMLDVGHEIPRSGHELDELARAFELIVMMASVGGG